MTPIEYAPGLPEGNFAAITPYLVPPGAKKVNVGDGFILDSATKLLGARPRFAFSSRVPLTDAAIESINTTRGLLVAGANTLKDDFEITPGFDLATLGRLRVPVVLMGLGHYGVAQVTQGLTSASCSLLRAILERLPAMSVRCDASRAYVLQGMPDRTEQIVMTSCPVVHAVDGVDHGFVRKANYEQLVVTLTDRALLQEQLPLLDVAAKLFPAKRRILALHQDYGNLDLWKYAQERGFETVRGANHQDFLRLYAETDIHAGNRVHAHLKCLSLGVVSFCTPFDLRQAYFAQSLDYPLATRLPDAALDAYDFARARAKRDAARATMGRFTAAVRKVFGLA